MADFPDGPDEWHRDMFEAMAKAVKENIARKEAGEKHLKPFKASVASGHGIGKSACVAWIILWIMSTRPWCQGVVTANTAEQLQTKTWPELAKWHQLLIHRHWFKWTATQFYYALCSEDRRKNYCFDAITWSEERTEGFQGLHNASGAVCVIFDEASALPDVLYDVADFALTDGEPFFFGFGNPTRNTGRFFETHHGKRALYWTRKVDSRSVRITNKEYINELVENYGEESDYVRVRVRGEFPASGEAQFIPVDIVEDAMRRKPTVDPQAPLLVGVDVARFGEDRSVIAFRRGQDAASIPMKTYRSLDTMQVAAQVAEAIAIWNPDYVFVDGVGVGGGVVDRLRQMGFKVIDINAGSKADRPQRYFNKRVEMWGEMRDWLVAGGCLPRDPELLADLIGPQYMFTASQQVKLERVEDMKKRGLASPDTASALGLTFATRTPTKDLITARGKHGRRRRMSDYDPLNYSREARF